MAMGGTQQRPHFKFDRDKMVSFSLSEYLTKFQTTDKKSFPLLQNPSGELNNVIDKLATSYEQIEDTDTLESLIDLCQMFPHLPTKLQTQITYLISSSVDNCTKYINSNLMSNLDYNDIIDLVPRWKFYLEVYGYLVHVLLYFQQEDIHTTASNANMNRNKKILNNNDNQNVTTFKRSVNQIESLCESILKVLDINLSRVFQTTPEKDLFIGLFTRPLYSLVEVEASIKIPSLKVLIQRIICISIKDHGQLVTAQSAIISNLTYFLHLSNFNAELLSILNNEYNYPQLTEDTLKEISNRIFSAKDTTGPKSISNFLVKLSELSPVSMLRQMSSLIKLLNNSSLTLRSAIVEACGNIIVSLSKNSQTAEHYKQKIAVLIELLEERFQDSNPYVRTKAIQGCLKLVEMSLMPNEKRLSFTRLSVRSLLDRSSLVRRNTIKLLSKLLLKHPFSGMHGTQLGLSNWKGFLQEAQDKLAKEEQSTTTEENIENRLDPIDTSEISRIEEAAETTNTTNPNKILKLKLLEVYYKDAIEFIENMHNAIDQVCQLLLSKNRNEVLEAMDFLVLTDAFGLEPCKMAIKKMLHLVWIKGTNDEGKSISVHLVECYRQLFLTVPENYTQRQSANYIALNLISLTKGSSVADLTSLEKLLCMMYEENLIRENVIMMLWEIYSGGSNVKPFPKENIHGSVIILGMLALANHEIVVKGLDLLLLHGLNNSDLVLCKYSCVALGRMIPRNGSTVCSGIDKKHEDEAVKRLYSKVIGYTTDELFYPMCEQALNALFTISSQPDVISSNLIKEKTMMTFGKPDNLDEPINSHDISRTTSLSHLLFIVGQVAIRILVYLEKCESEFKKRKIQAETAKGRKKDEQDDGTKALDDDDSKEHELEMIGGTNEDDFTDAIQFVKENELLFKDNSILGRFCPIVEEIVSNSTRFPDPMLQRTATLCLEKLMCVSSKYCEKSLPLLITVMEKSPDPIIRSNAVLGLGDMAVCFNNLVDENTDYLYRRLDDDNLMVQRTCLMTVTFLILAGQVKVKGQLGEMAKCLENPDQAISDMCRLFFTELATKDNAIYNGFIDIFSNLSSDKALNKDSFKKIIKFLLSFVDKERHQKQLSEKLFSRLIRSSNQAQWDDIAFVLNSIAYTNEKITTTIKEGFKLVSSKEN